MILWVYWVASFFPLPFSNKGVGEDERSSGTPISLNMFIPAATLVSRTCSGLVAMTQANTWPTRPTLGCSLHPTHRLRAKGTGVGKGVRTSPVPNSLLPNPDCLFLPCPRQSLRLALCITLQMRTGLYEESLRFLPTHSQLQKAQ